MFVCIVYILIVLLSLSEIQNYFYITTLSLFSSMYFYFFVDDNFKGGMCNNLMNKWGIGSGKSPSAIYSLSLYFSGSITVFPRNFFIT